MYDFSVALHEAERLLEGEVLESWNKEVFDIRLAKTGITSLKIFNAEADFLHLRGIKLLREGVELDSLPRYFCKGGREWEERSDIQSFKIGTIVDPYAFHTLQHVGENWIEILFEEPVEVDEIVVLPRTGACLNRSQSLTVSVVKDSGERCVLFDHLNDIREEIAEATGDKYLATSGTKERFDWLVRFFLRIAEGTLMCLPDYVQEWLSMSPSPMGLVLFLNEEILSWQGLKYVHGRGIVKGETQG